MSNIQHRLLIITHRALTDVATYMRPVYVQKRKSQVNLCIYLSCIHAQMKPKLHDSLMFGYLVTAKYSNTHRSIKSNHIIDLEIDTCGLNFRYMVSKVIFRKRDVTVL